MKLLFITVVYPKDYTFLVHFMTFSYLMLLPQKSMQRKTGGMAAIGVVNGLPSNSSHSRKIVSDVSFGYFATYKE